MKKIVFLTALAGVLILIFNSGVSFAGYEEYSKAVEAAKAGDKIFAFMHFRDIVEHDANSQYREKALFALGEYYFSVSDYNDSFKAFDNLLTQYPDSKMRPFALFYIYKMAKDAGKTDLAAELKKQILNWERVILIFKKSKEHKFRSPTGINYRLTHYVDRLEFFIDGKLQEQVLY
jgi:tetratricopeptide (TPR) repeat protein